MNSAEQNQPPHPAFGMEHSSTLWMTEALLGLCVLILLALAIFVWLRRKKKIPLPKALDPWVQLQQKLSALQWEESDFTNDFKILNDVLKSALELRLGKALAARTRRELVEELYSQTSLSSDFQAACAEFLETAEQVIFAEEAIDGQAGRMWQEKVGHWLEQLRREAPHQ